jgi:hypothetical protein
LADSDITEAGNAFGLHELVIGRFDPAPFSKAGALTRRWFMPM